MSHGLTVSAYFGSHMVLQRESPLRVWGQASPFEEIRVCLGDASGAARAGAGGEWEVLLRAQPGGGPFLLSVECYSASIVFTDVWVGEVWLLAGQSNIEWTASQFADSARDALLANLPSVRHFTLKPNRADAPTDEITGSWLVMDPDSALGFSAFGMAFGHYWQEIFEQPLGLVVSALGDTSAEMWLSEARTETDPGLSIAVNEYRAQVYLPANDADPVMDPRRRYAAHSLFNGMIHPLDRSRFRGIVWYQGESNGRRSGTYYDILQHLIAEWRLTFADQNLPVVIVQLPRFREPEAAPQTSAWADVRDAQARASHTPNTCLVCCIDLGDAVDIHPTNKKEFARRAVACIGANVYGHAIPWHGPVVKSCKAVSGAVRVTFDDAERGLVYRTHPLGSGFALAGADGVFHPALARVEGNLAFVSCGAVPAPVAVRYAWADHPPVTLFDNCGWPVAPLQNEVAASPSHSTDRGHCSPAPHLLPSSKEIRPQRT